MRLKKLCCLLLLLALISAPARAYSAASYALYDPLTGRFLLERAAGERRGMASTTKLMTALVAAELYDPAAEAEIAPEWCGIEGSSIYLRPGEVLSVRALLYGMLLCSGNDAAAALAGLGGDAPGFVARMNEKAAALGLADTHFDNPNGLDGPSHYSTARDLCLLAEAVLAEPALREIVGTRSAEMAGRRMNNHNKLLADEGVLGLKTGFTKACGRCLVSAMERDGRTLIAATLHAPDDWADHRALYAEGFAGLERTALVTPGPVGTVPMAGAGESGIYVEEAFSLALTPAERAETRVRLYGPRLCYPGIAAGEPWGRLRVELGETVLFETDVYFERTVPAPEPGFWQRLLGRLTKN